MKKLPLLLFCTLFILCSAVVHAYEAPDLIFTPDENGRYIYCNNSEFIERRHLADGSNEKPRYIMNNEDLGPDNYAMFISHVNHTGLRTEDKSVILKNGFDIEVDVRFIAKEDSVVKIDAIGFEVPQNVRYFLDGSFFTREEPWGCFNAWASYIGEEISEIDSGNSYKPVPFDGAEISLKAGEEFFLSEYIPNYSTVPYYRPVHILSDFEIVSGLMDVNVLAVKSNGTPGDRSTLAPDIAFGSYEYEHQHKGIADTLNKVDTYLSYTIDDYVWGDTKLDVKTYNKFSNGDRYNTWTSNINQSSDQWAKGRSAASDMIKFKYRDPAKLYLYGSNVPMSERNDIWYFDDAHSDRSTYKGTRFSKNNFIPNFELTNADSNDVAASMGNFGVFANYHMSITNNGNSDRYFLYTLHNTSNNLIILRDENGEIMEPYPLCKGYHPTKETDTLASVKLPAHKTTEFTITLVLTTNYSGGMENSFIISNTPDPIKTYEKRAVEVDFENDFSGMEYFKWENRELYRSYDKDEWEKVELSADVKKIFEGHWSEYTIKRINGGYAVKPILYDGIPYYIVQDFYKDVYFLDENFNLKNKIRFESYPTAISAGKHGVWISAGTTYYVRDNKCENALSGENLPVYNYGRFVLQQKNGKIYLSSDDINFFEVLYESPWDNDVITVKNGMYTDGENTSYDGVYRNCDEKNPLVIIAEDKILGFDSLPVLIDGVTYVPLRFLAESLGMSVEWTNNAAYVNGEKAECTLINGKSYTPVRSFCEIRNYSVNYDGENSIIEITK